MTLNVLVTGGLGYIGSHTVVELIQHGYEVVILDNLSNSSISVLDRIDKIVGKAPKLYLGDISDSEILKHIFKKHYIQSVMHFAGSKSVAEAEENPLLYFNNNVKGSITLFDEMTKARIERIIFSSSATVYGDTKNVKYSEDMPLKPINVYGKTKLMVEEILREIKKAYPMLGIAILRYFNPAGAHPSGVIGESPNKSSNNLMPCISEVAAGLREKLLIFGGDYPTSDGTALRDFIHVRDLALGHIASLRKLEGNPDMILVNLGTGSPCSVLDLVHIFENVSGKKIAYEIVERRQGDLAEYYADPTLAFDLLHWKTALNIRNMCEDAWRWQIKKTKVSN